MGPGPGSSETFSGSPGPCPGGPRGSRPTCRLSRGPGGPQQDSLSTCSRGATTCRHRTGVASGAPRLVLGPNTCSTHTSLNCVSEFILSRAPGKSRPGRRMPTPGDKYPSRLCEHNNKIIVQASRLAARPFSHYPSPLSTTRCTHSLPWLFPEPHGCLFSSSESALPNHVTCWTAGFDRLRGALSLGDQPPPTLTLRNPPIPRRKANVAASIASRTAERRMRRNKGRTRPTYMQGGWRKGTCFQEGGLVTTRGKRGGQPGGGGATGAAPALSIVFREPHIPPRTHSPGTAEPYLLPQSRGRGAEFHQLSTSAERGVFCLCAILSTEVSIWPAPPPLSGVLSRTAALLPL